MTKRLALILVFACSTAFAQTTTFIAHLKDLAQAVPNSPQSPPAFVELTLRNCAGAGTNPTIVHVNSGATVVFPVNLYPDGTGLISQAVYDQNDFVCGASPGVAFYHVRLYQGDSTRSVLKKLLFEDDYNIQGSTFTLDSASTRSGAVISPPPATAVLTNPSGNQTVIQPGGTSFNVQGNFAVASLDNVQLADQQSGSDACAKIATAIALLPSTGGTVDARGFQGAQSCAANPFNGVTIPVTLLIDNATFTTSHAWGLTSNLDLKCSGGATIKLAAGVNSEYVIQNADQTNGNSNIHMHGCAIDGNALNQSPNEGAGQRTGCLLWEKVTKFEVDHNIFQNCYHYGTQIIKLSQYGDIHDNIYDGILRASGALFGTGATLPTTTNEVYDIKFHHNTVKNVGVGDCAFVTGSNTAGAYGTARVHINDNTFSNCGDQTIELGDGSRDSEANNNIIDMPRAVNVSGSIARASNVVTATVTCSWASISCLTAFSVGSAFKVASVTDSSFNGAFTVLTVNYGSNTLTWSQTAANASSSSGTLIRTGNLALGSRAGLNNMFKGNVVNGTGSASDNKCEVAWHNGSENAPKDENIVFDDLCNSMGGDAFTTLADASGTVTQIVHRSKMDGTVGNDYVIASNTLKLRLLSGGFFSTSSGFAGTSFNQSDNLTFDPGTGVVIFQRSVSPHIQLKDLAQSITAGGLWRINESGTNFNIQMNTAAGGDFSSSFNGLQIDNSGDVIFPQNKAVFQGLAGFEVRNGLHGKWFSDAGTTLTADIDGSTGKVSAGSGGIVINGGTPLTGQVGSGSSVLTNNITSANLAAALSDETGTGADVFANTPTLTSPNISTSLTFVSTAIWGTSQLRLGSGQCFSIATAADGSVTAADIFLCRSAANTFSIGTTNGGTDGKLKLGGLLASNLLLSSTAPTISSGFGTSPSVTVNNGTANFRVNVGTGGTATSGVIGLPTAATGWDCSCEDRTTFSTTVFRCRQTADTTTSATIGNFNNSATAAAWVASDIVQVSCLAR